jgi:hypothetical protein
MRPSCELGAIRTAGYCSDSSLVGRTSMLTTRAGGIFESWMASFKSLVSRLLSEVEVAEQPDQCGEDSARFGRRMSYGALSICFANWAYCRFSGSSSRNCLT